jgi:hypothetical protein
MKETNNGSLKLTNDYLNQVTCMPCQEKTPQTCVGRSTKAAKVRGNENQQMLWEPGVGELLRTAAG